ncbi:MAG: thiamine phosphate synthase [Gemmatimonadota bacterium]
MKGLPKLHVVTSAEILGRPDFLDLALDLLVVLQRRLALHIRGSLPASRLFQIVDQLAAKADYVGACLIVNDRADIALAFDAVGIHLGARSLPVSRVRALAPSPRLIGYSAHAPAEAAAAERDGADFVFAGTIYPTPGHPDAHAGGPGLLGAIVEACSMPVLAIGGVTAESLPQVLSTGAYGAAVIRAVWAAADPVHAAAEIARLLET